MNEGKMDGYSLAAKMIRVRRAFYLSATEQALFYELINICNRNHWQEVFSCSNWELGNALNISNNTLHKARSTLVRYQLIAYTSGKNKKGYGQYSFCISVPATNCPDSKNTNAGTNNGPDLKARMAIIYPSKKTGDAVAVPDGNLDAGKMQHDGIVTPDMEAALMEENLHVKDPSQTLSALLSVMSSAMSSADFEDYYKQLNNKTKNKNNIFSENKFSGHRAASSFSIPFSPSQKNKMQQNEKQPSAHPAFKRMLDFWKHEFHPGFLFTAANGRQLNSIIKKIDALIKSMDQDPTPENITTYFRFICSNLPDWYKDKDLHLIDSGFNEIILGIKKMADGTNYHQPAESRYNAAAKFFK